MKLNARFKQFNIYNLLLKTSFLVFIFSIFGQMFFANKLAVKSSELAELNERKLVLEKEVAKLEFENSVLSSLNNVETRAKQLGFVYISGSVIAIKPAPTVSAVNIPYAQ